MKVKELMALLSKYDPENEVCINADDVTRDSGEGWHEGWRLTCFEIFEDHDPESGVCVILCAGEPNT